MHKTNTILFLMHVSWFWIKQRPQFIAEGLSASQMLTVACMEDYNNQPMLDEASSSHLKLRGFRIFKNPNNLKWKSRVNGYWKKWQLRKLVRENKVIWFNAPAQFTHARNLITTKHTVIYDCMDNAIAFYEDETAREQISNIEAALVARANIIFTSANKLKQHLLETYKLVKEITVINNALQPLNNIKMELKKDIKALMETGAFVNLVYVGTIASWLDFEVLLPTLEKYINLRFILVGPSDVTIPPHDRIIPVGSIPHGQVAAVMQLADGLIMPFRITPLIEAVNPVKAYEYIASGKPVILTAYGETLPFEDYAYLYNGKSEIEQLLGRLSEGKLPAKKEKATCEEFAAANTWASRVKQMQKKIEALNY